MEGAPKEISQIQKRRHTAGFVVLILVALVAGIIIGLVSPKMIATHLNTDWKPLAPGDSYFGVRYRFNPDADELFLDLPMPDIKSVSGKAKFINPVGKGEATEFGYIVNMEMASLDLAKVPEHYKKSQPMEGNSGFVRPPLTQASYEVEWEFQFKDKDGFLIGKYKSPEEQPLTSGQTNVFQGKLQDKIPYDEAVRVHQVEIYPLIVKCYSCERKR
jgi:hypothetical protein